jgi:hypothetical protein
VGRAEQSRTEEEQGEEEERGEKTEKKLIWHIFGICSFTVYGYGVC